MKFMAVISVQRLTKIVNFMALWSGVLLLGLGSNYHIEKLHLFFEILLYASGF